MSTGSRMPARPTESQLARERALQALHEMRAGLSLRAAAAHAHTTPATVRKYVGRALRQAPGGHFVPTSYDRYARRLRFLSKEGLIEISVHDSRTASKVAEYFAAVDRYLKTGNTEQLRAFRGKSVRAGKRTYPFRHRSQNPQTSWLRG